jgi:hypothetical protein
MKTGKYSSRTAGRDVHSNKDRLFKYLKLVSDISLKNWYLLYFKTPEFIFVAM